MRNILLVVPRHEVRFWADIYIAQGYTCELGPVRSVCIAPDNEHQVWVLGFMDQDAEDFVRQKVYALAGAEFSHYFVHNVILSSYCHEYLRSRVRQYKAPKHDKETSNISSRKDSWLQRWKGWWSGKSKSSNAQ